MVFVAVRLPIAAVTLSVEVQPLEREAEALFQCCVVTMILRALKHFKTIFPILPSSGQILQENEIILGLAVPCQSRGTSSLCCGSFLSPPVPSAPAALGGAAPGGGDCGAAEGAQRHAGVPLPGEGAGPAPLRGERPPQAQVGSGAYCTLPGTPCPWRGTAISWAAKCFHTLFW